MNFSVYDISIPAYIRSLEALLGILEKAKVFALSKKIDEKVLLQTRLIPDQFPLVRQIQIACDGAKLFIPRLTEIQAPVFEDTEANLDELKIRVQKTLDFVKTVKPEAFEGCESKTISFPHKPGFYLDAKTFIFQYALPNLYFHITTAYSILRTSGVDVGKSDYLGKVEWSES